MRTIVVVLIDIDIMFTPDDGELLYPFIYTKLVKKLNFIANTRPSIAFSLVHLSPSTQSPRQPHYQDASHILKYLQDSLRWDVFAAREKIVSYNHIVTLIRQPTVMLLSVLMMGNFFHTYPSTGSWLKS